MTLSMRAVSGHPSHVPTEQSRRLVRNLAGLAVNQADIARMVEVNQDTLKKYYADDLEAGRAEANLKVAQSMFKAATREHNPNVVAGMFWLKNRAGWKGLEPGAQVAGPLTLHLTAARAVGKEIIEQQAMREPPTIQHEPVTNGTQAPRNILDMPPPLE